MTLNTQGYDNMGNSSFEQGEVSKARELRMKREERRQKQARDRGM
jgi:hypothetical protein